MDNEFHVLVPFDGITAVGVSSAPRSGIHSLQGAFATAAGLAFSRPLIITSAVEVENSEDPEATGLAGGFGYRDGSHDAVLTRFVPSASRFRPRGRVLGKGPVLDLARDGAGRLWARMPREGACAGSFRRISELNLGWCSVTRA